MFKSLTLAAGAAVLLGACAVEQTTPPTFAGCRTWDMQVGQPNLGAVSVQSPELAKVIGVLDMQTSRTGTGMAAVQTTVQNCTDVDVVLLMRTRFTGDRGQSEPPSAWKTVHLAPRGQATYGENAVSGTTRSVGVDIYDANRGQSQFAPGQTYTVPMQQAR
ncbi:hypothetical protein [Ramlibacter algicola]|uniref:Lipoprotein n=1 Tax=Ramlibacter algicola TaxID=2795217 RepID=A0A934Q4F5_9BURK|nr:hypothetical protein [Ramlibacter algicola]MBK0394079.1 hypothetical protein [Ramlibacter algicola]